MKYLLPILIFFSGCSASYHIKQGFKKNPILMAKVTRDSFPCIELFRTDTAFVYTDSTVLIDCPDYGGRDSIINYVSSLDTSSLRFRTNNAQIKKVKVPVTLPIRTQIITKYFEDSAKITVLKKELGIAQSDGEEWKGKAQRRGNANLWFIAAILGLIAAIVLLIRSKLKQWQQRQINKI